jgi:hypothetical protein
MLKMFGALNFAIGMATLSTFVYWTEGDVVGRFSTTALILLVGGSLALFAGGTGIGRLSLILHGWAATLFMMWAYYSLKSLKGLTGGQSLRGLFSIFISDDWLYPLCLVVIGLGLTFAGCWIDHKGGLAFVKDYLKNRPRRTSEPVKVKKEAPKVLANASIDPSLLAQVKKNESSQSKRVVPCKSCGKKIKVKASGGQVRCPVCREVMTVK